MICFDSNILLYWTTMTDWWASFKEYSKETKDWETFYIVIESKMNKLEKLIDLLRERKPNFDDNHILDMMYSEWTIFIKDWKPVYAYDEDIFPNTERMIINKKIWFISRLVENDKIDYHNKINYDISLAINRVPKKTTREERLLMMLAIKDEPINFLISILK